jgi:RHS repeat-associated protein
VTFGTDLIAEHDPWGGLLRRYVHGPGIDNPIVWYEGSGTSDRRFLMADERGSIVSISDSAGYLININAYDEYGIPAPGNVGRFGYTGQIWLPELKLWYYKARMYSPTLGRFLQTDPIGYGDGMNWYDYVGGDPVNFVDPLGLMALGDDGDDEIIVQGKKVKKVPHFCDTAEGKNYTSCNPAGIPGLPGEDTNIIVICGGTWTAAGDCVSPDPQPKEDEPSTLEKFGQCTVDQLGLGELASVGTVAAGQPIPGTKPFVTPGSSKGTSAAGLVANRVFGNARLPTRLPTIVGGPGTGRKLAVAGTKSAARFAARAVPFVGWAFLAYDAGSIAFCTFSSD